MAGDSEPKDQKNPEPKDQKVENPADSFASPSAIVKDKDLSLKQKTKALDTWEQDAHQLLTASNEGMPGPDEGRARKDPTQLSRVVRAKLKLGEKPASKPSQ
jgi:hypothetical protein